VEEMVSDGAVEVGVTGRPTQNTALESEILCADVMVLVTPANAYYTKLREKKVSIGELLTEPMILREEGSGTQKAADDYLAKTAEKPLNIIIRSNDQEAIKRMVAAGAGVSVMSYFAIEDMEREGRVYCYPLRPDEERCFYTVYRKDRKLSETARRFLAAAHRKFKHCRRNGKSTE
ncbi:MAG: hypothetical protein IKI65_01200, partial [Firmicutes bacterium]|nr:hypothetical protein [Bacillota bacterium]